MHPEFASLDRRALIRTIGLLLGASALPAGALAAPKARARRFLAAPQFALLSALTDTILPVTDTPGALAAKVPERLDGLLANWASAGTRTTIVEALARVEAAAVKDKLKSFAALSPAERAALLGPYDAAAVKSVPRPAGTPQPSFFSQVSYVADPGYLKIKELTINLFYYSEVGSANELLYEHVPGKFEPSIKLTPTSRPYLGPGPF